jgi:hypothetical protein
VEVVVVAGVEIVWNSEDVEWRHAGRRRAEDRHAWLKTDVIAAGRRVVRIEAGDAGSVGRKARRLRE